MTRFLIVLIPVVAVVGVLLMLIYPGAANATAIWVSAAVAVAVQLAAFAVGRAAALGGGSNIMARIGSGALLRLVAIVAYALIVAKASSLPLTPALVSLLAFFFLTTLIEPLLIK